MASQTWPSALPDPSPAYGFDVAGRALYGNASRVYNTTRLRDGEIIFVFNAQWFMLDAEFQTFKTWFQDTLLDGALPFNVGLVLGDTEAETIEAFFMGGQFNKTTGHGLVHSVSAQLVCHNPAFLSEATLDELLALGVDFSFVDYIDPLNELVEVTLPPLL